MYNKWTKQEELTPAQMRQIRQGFRRALAGGKYRPDFIVNNCDEILGIAYAEYARAIKRGEEIEDPVAWTIHCARQRTKNFLQARSVRPEEVSSEKVTELADESASTPSQLAELADRERKVREAVAKLNVKQRQLIALTYFGGLSVREAARQLKWGPSKAQRCHESALSNLRRHLAVKSSDHLDPVSIGLAASMSLQGGRRVHVPAGVETMLDKVDGAWGRFQDLVRRASVSGGGEAAGVAASGGVGRGWGTTCAAAVGIVCSLGAGAVVAGVDGGTHHDAAKEEAPRSQPAKRTVALALTNKPTVEAESAATTAAPVASPSS